MAESLPSRSSRSGGGGAQTHKANTVRYTSKQGVKFLLSRHRRGEFSTGGRRRPEAEGRAFQGPAHSGGHGGPATSTSEDADRSVPWALGDGARSPRNDQRCQPLAQGPDTTQWQQLGTAVTNLPKSAAHAATQGTGDAGSSWATQPVRPSLAQWVPVSSFGRLPDDGLASSGSLGPVSFKVE